MKNILNACLRSFFLIVILSVYQFSYCQVSYWNNLIGDFSSYNDYSSFSYEQTESLPLASTSWASSFQNRDCLKITFSSLNQGIKITSLSRFTTGCDYGTEQWYRLRIVYYRDTSCISLHFTANQLLYDTVTSYDIKQIGASFTGETNILPGNWIQYDTYVRCKKNNGLIQITAKNNGNSGNVYIDNIEMARVNPPAIDNPVSISIPQGDFQTYTEYTMWAYQAEDGSNPPTTSWDTANQRLKIAYSNLSQGMKITCKSQFSIITGRNAVLSFDVMVSKANGQPNDVHCLGYLLADGYNWPYDIVANGILSDLSTNQTYRVYVSLSSQTNVTNVCLPQIIVRNNSDSNITVYIDNVGMQYSANNPLYNIKRVNDVGLYTDSTSVLKSSWVVATGVVTTKYAIGTAYNDNSICDWTITTDTSVTKSGLHLYNGLKYYFSIKAKDSQGYWSSSEIGSGIIPLYRSLLKESFTYSEHSSGKIPQLLWSTYTSGGVSGGSVYITDSSTLKIIAGNNQGPWVQHMMGVHDYILEYDCCLISPEQCAAVFRVQGTQMNQGYQLQLNSTTGVISIDKVDTWQNIGWAYVDGGIEKNKWYHITVSLKSSNIKIYMKEKDSQTEDHLYIDANDSTWLWGGIAFKGWNNSTTEFDNLRVSVDYPSQLKMLYLKVLSNTTTTLYSRDYFSLSNNNLVNDTKIISTDDLPANWDKRVIDFVLPSYKGDKIWFTLITTQGDYTNQDIAYCDATGGNPTLFLTNFTGYRFPASEGSNDVIYLMELDKTTHIYKHNAIWITDNNSIHTMVQSSYSYADPVISPTGYYYIYPKSRTNDSSRIQDLYISDTARNFEQLIATHPLLSVPTSMDQHWAGYSAAPQNWDYDMHNIWFNGNGDGYTALNGNLSENSLWKYDVYKNSMTRYYIDSTYFWLEPKPCPINPNMLIATRLEGYQYAAGVLINASNPDLASNRNVVIGDNTTNFFTRAWWWKPVQ